MRQWALLGLPQGSAGTGGMWAMGKGEWDSEDIRGHVTSTFLCEAPRFPRIQALSEGCLSPSPRLHL